MTVLLQEYYFAHWLTALDVNDVIVMTEAVSIGNIVYIKVPQTVNDT
jgi:hypothetical protein